MKNFTEADFYWEPKEEWFWPFELFSELKATLIKIKLSMTCVYEEYEIKKTMVQEQLLQLKMKFLLGCKMKIII